MPLAELFLNKKKLSSLSILPVFPNHESVVLPCLEFVLVQIPLCSRDRRELPIYLVLWSLAVQPYLENLVTLSIG